MTATSTQATPAAARGTRTARWMVGAVFVSLMVLMMATAETGPVDPAEARVPQSTGTAIVNSSLIVFREGLEAVLIFAAVTASFLGANKIRRRPVVIGAALAFAATVATWVAVQALLDVASPLGPRLEAITGFIAIVVLLIVLNWFLHTVYWTGWIARHHRQRRRLLASSGFGVTLGLVALGFTSVYREGFETVLFLQTLELQHGTGVVLQGVGLGLLGTAIVGVLTFYAQRKLPYKRMLVLTGVLIGGVLVVMIGGTAATFQDLGWLPRHDLPFVIPTWIGAWFEVYGSYETVGAQIIAAAFVIGSYRLAEHMRVARPKARGEQVARRADAPPELSARGPEVGARVAAAVKR